MAKSIGEILKEIRLQAGLTQKQWCDGVISVSQYSKIERGVHKIDMDILYKLLDNNMWYIAAGQFLEKVLKTSSEVQESKLLLSIGEAIISRNEEKLIKLKKQVDNLVNPDPALKEAIKIASQLVVNQTMYLDKTTLPKISERVRRLYKVETWNVLILVEFELVLPFLNLEELDFLVGKIYKSYLKLDNRLMANFTERFILVLLKYLNILLNRQVAKSEFTKPLEMASTIVQSMNEDSFFGYGIEVKKIESLINKDKKLYKDIVRTQKILGFVSESESEDLKDNKYIPKR